MRSISTNPAIKLSLPHQASLAADSKSHHSIAVARGASQQLQPTDASPDLDLIDSLFDDAFSSRPDSSDSGAPTAANQTRSAEQPLLNQRQKHSGATATAAPAKPLALPKRASSLPWGQVSKTAAASQNATAQQPSNSRQLKSRSKKDQASRSTSSKRPSSSAAAAVAGGLPVVNPWAAAQAARQQQQQQYSRKPAAADRLATEQYVAGAEDEEEEDEDLLLRADANSTTAAEGTSSPLFRWPQSSQQQQQQEQSQPRYWQPPSNPVVDSHRPQWPQQAAGPSHSQQQLQESSAGADDSVDSLGPTSSASSAGLWGLEAGSAAGDWVSYPAAAAPAAPTQARTLQDQLTAQDIQQQEHQQQQQQQRGQRQQDLPAINMDGVVRSTRRLKLQQRQRQQQQQQQQRQQQAVPLESSAAEGQPLFQPAAGASLSPAAAGDIGRLPLFVPGAQARGDEVSWTQPPVPQLLSSPPQQQQQQQAPPGGRSAATMKQPAEANSSKGTSRVRRVRRGVLQGAVLTTPAPDAQQPPTLSTAAAAARPSAAAPVPSSTVAGSSSTTSSKSMSQQELQQQLATLDHSNWGQLAQQLLPELFDPSWHSSMYALMLDVWPVVLTQAAAAKVSTQQQQQQQQQPHQVAGADAAVQWALSCCAMSQQGRYVWCSAVLALLDCIADDEAARLSQTAAVLPLEVLAARVLPAAAVVDEDLHAGLQETVQKLLQQHQKQQQSLLLQADANSQATVAADAADAAERVAAGQAPGAAGLENWSRLADAAAAAAGVASKSASSKQQQWQQQQQQLLTPKPTTQQQDIPGSTTAAAAAAAAAAGGAGEGDVSSGVVQEVVQALAELAALQGIYPGVQLSALAHVADTHGVWV